MIDTVTCNFCERDIPIGTTRCPYCGHMQKTASDWRNYYLRLAVGLALMLIVFFGWSHFVGWR